MSQSDLAQALGISQPMVSRLVKRGMPADVDGAVRWRAQHLNIAQRKRPAIEATPAAGAVGAVLERARSLADTALDLLPLGRIGEVEGALRSALRAVPLAHRPALTASIPSDVLAYLTRDLAAWFERHHARPAARADAGQRLANACATDRCEAEALAYAVAAGEVDVWAD